jgi:hypothetical protein
MAMSFNESRMLREAYTRVGNLELRILELEQVVLSMNRRGRKSDDVISTLERIEAEKNAEEDVGP